MKEMKCNKEKRAMQPTHPDASVICYQCYYMQHLLKVVTFDSNHSMQTVVRYPFVWKGEVCNKVWYVNLLYGECEFRWYMQLYHGLEPTQWARPQKVKCSTVPPGYRPSCTCISGCYL